MSQPATSTRVDRRFVLAGGAAAALAALGWASTRPREALAAESFAFELSDPEWRKRLTPAQYDVLRQAGTERPYSSPLNKAHRVGRFVCAGCALPQFSSTTKFDSGTGWPSFWQPLEGALIERKDRTLGMLRTEVLCQRCGSHGGHVFDDGPKPTGLRYCMNGLALQFVPGEA
jgi:peptide-methionine (R)-S-oxide reductase